MTSDKSEIGDWYGIWNGHHHHHNYQWWEYAGDKNPPHLLMTYSHHGGILSCGEFAG